MKTRNIVCKKCFLKLKSLSELAAHAQKHKSKSNKAKNGLNFYQSIKKENKTSVLLDKHRMKSLDEKLKISQENKIDTDERPFKCNECEKKFIRKEHLKRHKLIHTEEKLNECDQCEYRCSREDALAIHKRVHSEQRLFRCDLCEIKFKRSGDLIVHRRIHMGEKFLSF